jgi:hypothetical protein
MVILNPVSVALGVAQLGMGVAGAFGEQRKHEDQVAQATFRNTMSREKTRISNEYRQRAFGRQVEFAKQQQEFNADAANRAYITEQARFNEQVAQFAFNQVNFSRDLAQQMGVAAAGERYGKSAQRMAALDTLGQYGRNQAILARSLSSAAQQSQRNLEEVGRNWRQADYQVYGSVMEGPMLEMAEPLYQPGAGPNMALSIGNAALGATSSFFSGAKGEMFGYKFGNG